MDQINVAKDFIDFISKSPTKCHAVDNIKSNLLKLGYKPLSFEDKWEIKLHGKYLIEQDNSALIAFYVGEELIEKGIRLVCAHTDSPTFKVKPIAEMRSADGHVRINTQGYAWPILTSWFDRPLSLAGRVALKGSSTFKPDIRLVDLDSPILLIPNVAFHLTKGKSESGISKQKEMLPILGIVDKETDVEGLLKRLVTEKLGIASPEEILEYELYLYPYDKGQLIGINSDFILTPRQDDLAMVYAAYRALAETQSEESTKMIAFFDAEEETNSTLGGADSPFLRNVLIKIIRGLNGNDEDIIKMIHHSFAVSLDTSFAVHPNYMECGDPTCSPVINKGIAIKYDANMHYATTALSSSIFQNICKKANVAFQKVAANSDLRTGGTISAFLQTQVEMKCVEVGIPSWAVHSAYESCGTKDFYDLIRVLNTFWEISEK